MATIIELVKENGGLEYAIEMMRDYHQKALTILMEFEDLEARNALKNLIDFVIERKQ